MQNLSQQKLQLKQLVTGENGIIAAIEALKVLLPIDSPKFNGLLQLEADFNQLKLNDIKGIISEEQFRLAINQIRDRLLQLIDLLDDKDFQQPVAEADALKKRSYATYWIGGGLLLVIAAAFLIWQPWSVKPIEPPMVLVEGANGFSDFYIGKYEVTVKEFKAFVKATQYITSAERSKRVILWENDKQEEKYGKGIDWQCDVNGNKRTDAEYDDYPVIFVLHEDAVAYAQWLSKETGKNYRLPSNPEWYYAATGGNKSRNLKFYGSNDLNIIAWFNENAGGTTHPVGQKLPNELGIYDMAGNVSEWCNDKHPDNEFSYIARGGAWTFGSDYLNPKQVDAGPVYGNSFIGFRLVRDL